jgi:hypothetical protein
LPVRTGAAAGPAASGVIVRVVAFPAFCGEQDGEELGPAVAVLSGLSRASVLVDERPLVLASLARVWFAAVLPEPVDGLLLEPEPGSSDEGAVDEGVGVGVGVGVTVGVGVGVGVGLVVGEVGADEIVDGLELGFVPCVPQFGLFVEPGEEDVDPCGEPDWL